MRVIAVSVRVIAVSVRVIAVSVRVIAVSGMCMYGWRKCESNPIVFQGICEWGNIHGICEWGPPRGGLAKFLQLVKAGVPPGFYVQTSSYDVHNIYRDSGES